MKRPGLLAGLAVLALSLFVLSGTAFAHSTHHKKAKPRAESSDPGSSAPETCVVHALPSSFMDQGEFGLASERAKGDLDRSLLAIAVRAGAAGLIGPGKDEALGPFHFAIDA